MKFALKFSVLLWLFLPLISHAQTVSFTDGIWLKFKVTENGVYRITFNDLKNAGVNPDNINPAQIHLYAFPTGMLPQKNTATIPVNQQVAITVTGQSDGKFDNGDEILFYGEGPDYVRYRNDKEIFAYQHNLYSNENFYMLRIGSENGARMTKSTSTAGGRPVIDQYQDYGYYETDSYNDLKSGREWFGEQFDVKNEITIRFNMPGIVPNGYIKFVSSLMAQSYDFTTFRIAWNNTEIFSKKMDTIPQEQYGLKGFLSNDTTIIYESTVKASTVSNQDIKISFTKGGLNRSVGYLNYIIFTLTRKLSMYDNTMVFHLPAINNGDADISIASFPADGTVWDVSNPFAAIELPVSVSGSIGKVVSNMDDNRTLVAFSKGSLKTPTFIENVPTQHIKDYSTPDLLIVSHPDFLSEANRLASHRSSSYGLDVKVVTPQEIYNEFSGGRQDVSAIRNYVRYLYQQSPNKLKDLLVFGRGSYDYKNRVFNNSNFVPIYESRNSLHPLLTYASDDYYTFLETGEGDWSEEIEDNHTLDIGVGRLPVTTLKQATDVVNKLIAYDQKSEKSLWKQRILFVADDGDSNLHQAQAEGTAELFEVLYNNYHTSKVYLDAFEQQKIASGQISPKATAALARELDRGYDIVNYTGHGSERIWMNERILDQDTPLKMRNDNRLPLFITATCEFGRHDDPILASTAEMLLTREKFGAIGLVTTSRPVSAQTNTILNKAFYAAYFNNNITDKDLGAVFAATKNNSINLGNRNFSLLGDPSLRFEQPKEEAVITTIQTSEGTQVLKALSKVTLTGEVRLNSNLSTSFNGMIEVEVFDHRNAYLTLGDENPKFNYRVWDHSLFRGKAKVVNGEFALEFVVPEGISNDIQKGKIVLFASTSDGKREALGTQRNVDIGGTASNPAADVNGPSIELFMGDTTFVNGGYTNSNTYLVGRIFDKSGINISGYANGTLEATLDGTQTFIVNDYFVANEDDFTTGIFSYPLSNLSEGQHTITFKAYDTYGNPGTATVTFIVGASGALVVEEVYAYPNPFGETNPATIEFKHNRAGEDLEVQVAIYNSMGQLADRREFLVPSSTYKVALFDWGGFSPNGTKMGNGLYLVKLIIRSVSDGAKNDKIARLILNN